MINNVLIANSSLSIVHYQLKNPRHYAARGLYYFRREASCY